VSSGDSAGGGGDCSYVVVDLACDVAFEASDDFAFAESVCGSSFHVRDRGFVVAAETDHDDGPEGGVGLAVPGTVESVAVGLARRDAYGVAAAQCRVARFGVEPFGVVTGRAQQRASGFVARAVRASVSRSCRGCV